MSSKVECVRLSPTVSTSTRVAARNARLCVSERLLIERFQHKLLARAVVYVDVGVSVVLCLFFLHLHLQRFCVSECDERYMHC